MDLKSLINLDAKGLAQKVNGFDPLLLENLKQNAIKFAKENTEDLTALGTDLVNAILKRELFTFTPLPELSEDADPAAIAAYQLIVLERTNTSALINAAQLEHSERIARILEGAKKIASLTFGIIAGSAGKLLAL